MPFWEIMGISVDWKWRNWLWSGKFLCVHSLSIYFLKYREKEEGKPFDKFVILKWQFIFKICNFNILFYMHTRIKLFFYRFSSMLKKGKRELSLGWPSSILLLYQIQPVLWRFLWKIFSTQNVLLLYSIFHILQCFNFDYLSSNFS